MRLATILTASSVVLAASAAAAETGGFDLAKSPEGQRGRVVTLSNGTKSYADQQGIYVAVLPSDATVTSKPLSGTTSGTSTVFKGTFAGHAETCTVVSTTLARSGTLEGYQRDVEAMLAPGGSWDKSSSNRMNVQERTTISFGGGSGRPVRAAAWVGTGAEGGRPYTKAVLQFPTGLAIIGCTGGTTAESKRRTVLVFRIAEGVL